MTRLMMTVIVIYSRLENIRNEDKIREINIYDLLEKILEIKEKYQKHTKRIKAKGCRK